MKKIWKIVLVILVLLILLVGGFYFYNKYYIENKIVENDSYIKNAPSETITNESMGISFNYPNYLHKYLMHYHESPADIISFYKDSENKKLVLEISQVHDVFDPKNFNDKFGGCGHEPKELTPLIFSLFFQKSYALCMSPYKVNNMEEVVINNKTFYSYSIESYDGSRNDIFILSMDGFYLKFDFYHQDPNTIKDILNSINYPLVFSVNYSKAYKVLMNSDLYKKTNPKINSKNISSYKYESELNRWIFNLSDSFGQEDSRYCSAYFSVDANKVYYTSDCSQIAKMRNQSESMWVYSFEESYKN